MTRTLKSDDREAKATWTVRHSPTNTFLSNKTPSAFVFVVTLKCKSDNDSYEASELTE